MKAQLCPVCNGTGEVRNTELSSVSSSPFTKVCHGCHGQGWVSVADSSMLTPLGEALQAPCPRCSQPWIRHDCVFTGTVNMSSNEQHNEEVLGL